MAYAALAASLFLHLACFVIWPGFAFKGNPAAQLHAGLRRMPVLHAAQGGDSATKAFAALASSPGRQESTAEKPRQAAVSAAPAVAAHVSEEQGHASSGDYIPIELLDQKPVFLQDPGDTTPALPDPEQGQIVVQLLIS